MQEEGVDVEIPTAWDHSLRTLEIHTPGIGSQVRDCGTNGAEYAINLRIVSLARVTLTTCELSSERDNDATMESFVLSREPVCNFGGLTLSWPEVLNDRIENGLDFSCRGKSVEGWILFKSTLSIPEEYREGAMVPIKLTFEDEFGNATTEIVNVQVLRASKRNFRPRPRRRLFDVPADKHCIRVDRSSMQQEVR
jgi:hypothetical protein